jgi:hypothetical protein
MDVRFASGELKIALLATDSAECPPTYRAHEMPACLLAQSS